MVPKDVKAIIFLFPDNKNFVAERQAEDLRLAKGKQEKLNPTIFWMKQTVRCALLYPHCCLTYSMSQIGNACGTMALIHAIANVRPITGISSVMFTTDALNM